MNAINTSSSGPPTMASARQQAAQSDGAAATKPATPFIALLAALGSANGTGLANVDAAANAGADVASLDEHGHAASPGHTMPDAAPASGRRHRDMRAETPALAFGVPLTIAAIPVAGLTTGKTLAASSPAAGAAQSQVAGVTAAPSPASTPSPMVPALDLTATPSLATGDFVATTDVPTSAAAVDSTKRAATLANNTPSGDVASGFATIAPDVAARLATTPNTDTLQTAVTDGRGGNMQPVGLFTADTSVTPIGSAAFAAAAGAVTGSVPVNAPAAGVMASGSAADAANATPSKASRHNAPDIIVADGWGGNAGTMSGIGNAGQVAAPAHPAVSTAAQQIATQAKLLHNGQSAEMQLRLRPPDLGDVRVILRRDAAGALSAHLIPATRQAGDVLNANLHHLRNALDQHSEGQRAAVSVGQRDVADQRQQHMNGGHSSHEDETSATHPATPAAGGDRPAAQRTGRIVATNTTVDYDA